MITAILLLLFCLLIPAIWRKKMPSARDRRHRRYRQNAERVLCRLTALDSDGARLKYLRKINPYVFEELLLLAFERQGHLVVRNQTYSSDGGLDGQVFIDGKRWLIQAKRYRRTISPQHIREFGELITREQCCGFFIHTGRTGRKSVNYLQCWRTIQLISGQRLLDLLAGRQCWYHRSVTKSVAGQPVIT
ncbi:restriction endonuclease [Salmonella enterica]|uniref:Restriction endonuclease n=3 Tax=Salmonella TaxID=590 RepID=A0A744VEA2_SALER|nr:restriction endonuclease [Salmonella enterica]EDT6403890.1 restriction endonuclease [Salmonella enterica subsp. enterica]EEA2718341.1 restriction endonuclease [Salmonella enterica subsp. enterica serovar Chester]EGI5934680.1 restriction endonuclease [Salmonella enterica subsp. enterica serovar Urbana]CBJ94798.1 putative membrane protein [Salmonella bongori]HBN1189678.1 restriction endonuclease [Salmonella enterica subsp. enterica serovar Schwarzengrund]